jgi:hypothetical protein
MGDLATILPVAAVRVSTDEAQAAGRQRLLGALLAGGTALRVSGGSFGQESAAAAG